MRYRPEIDGLRGVAVIGVVLYHADFAYLPGGFAGVDVFFVLSGYLIASLAAEERSRTGRVAWVPFLARRARRLVPTLVLVSLVCVPLAYAILLPGALKDFGQSLVAGLAFAANLLFWHESGYFATQGDKPMLHLWSLGVEGQFYLLAPLLFGVLARGWVLPIAGASLCAALWAGTSAPDAAFYLLPFRLWEFLAGAAVALYRLRAPGLGGWLGLAMIGAAFLVVRPGWAWPHLATLLPVAGTALVLAAPRAPWLLGLRPLVSLGGVSYAFYLWHYPLLVLADQGGGAIPAAAMIALALGLSYAGGVWPRTAAGQRPWPAGTGIAAAALAALGLALHLSAGFPGRLPAPAQALLIQAKGPAPACHDRLDAAAVRAGVTCRIGDPAARPTLALIGDSHAAHLVPPLADTLAKRGQAALVVSASWCLPVPGFGTDAPGRGRGCAALMTAAWDSLLQQGGPGTLILAAEWANGTTGTRGTLPPVTYGSAKHPAENPAAFRAAVAALARALRGTGHSILVIEPLPEFPARVPERLARQIWSGTPASGAMAPIDHAVRNADALPALKAFAAQTGAARLATAPLFCTTAQHCAVLDGDRLLFRDDNHLTPAGAARVVAKIFEVLDAPPDPAKGARDDPLPLRQPSDQIRPAGLLHR